MGDDRLTFDHIRDLIYPDRDIVGPPAPVDDVRIAAGLLFQHWNDRSVRVLHDQPGCDPRVETSWYADFSGCIGHREFWVTRHVVDELRRQRLVSGTPHWGYTDDHELRLNGLGQKTLLEKWIRPDGVMDLFAAGYSVSAV